jgi:hypothetical protein
VQNLNAYRESGVQGRAWVVMPAASLALIIIVILLLCAFVALPTSLLAQALAGRVNNGTTGKPSAGDRVVLITLRQGMEEVAHTRSDAGGHFSFHLPDTGPHLIRAIHQGVAYHRLVPPGSNSVAVQVFDVSRKVEGITVTADVMRFQAQGGELQGTRLFAVNNASNPPRTRMHGNNFEFFLPDGAVIDRGIATTAGGQPVNSSPVPVEEKNRYGFVFPLRPGETELQVVFHMAYRGELSVDPDSLYGTEHFVVMVPKTMLFTAAPGLVFQAMEDPRQSDALVRVMSNTRAGQPLRFTISGTGMLRDPGDDSLGAPHPVGEETVAPPARDSSQQGGLSSTKVGSDSPERNRWYVLGGIFIVLLAGLGFYLVRRTRPAAVFRSGDPDRKRAHPPSPAVKSSNSSDLLLDRLKNELFQLEVKHQQGRISAREYKRARAALDQALDRAIKPAPQK